MSFNKSSDKLVVAVISEGESELIWLQGMLGILDFEVILHHNLKTLKSDLHEKKFNLIISSNALYKKLSNLVLNSFSLTYPPLLIISQEKENFSSASNDKLTVDFIPRNLCSPEVFRHSIETILRDYKKDQKLRRLAHYDNLTGAANRHLFMDRLKQLVGLRKRNKSPLSVMYFDLDKFKYVNDNFGHGIGDKLLMKFVDIVNLNLRQSDTLGRLGGDEFAVILPNSAAQDSTQVATKILKSINLEHQFEDMTLSIHSSIGIACVEKSLTITADELIKSADSASYQSKRAGGDQINTIVL